MKSFDPTYLTGLSIPHHVVGIIRRLGEYKGRQELHQKEVPEALENLRRVAVIQSTESSNRIEGIIADHERIRKIVEENITPIKQVSQPTRDCETLQHDSQGSRRVLPAEFDLPSLVVQPPATPARDQTAAHCRAHTVPVCI